MVHFLRQVYFPLWNVGRHVPRGARRIGWLTYSMPMLIQSLIKPARTESVPAESQKFLSFQQLQAMGEPLSDFLTVRMRRAMTLGLKSHAVRIGRDSSSLVREAVDLWAVSNGLDFAGIFDK